MPIVEPPSPEPLAPQALLALATVADLQDHLLAAGCDLERLQRLLDDASQTLLGHFHAAAKLVNALSREAAHHPQLPAPDLHQAMQHLAGAVTAMQFQDMASQLIVHTHTRLRACAERLGAEGLADDGEGSALACSPPVRPNPVTQDEMDAGSVELF